MNKKHYIQVVSINKKLNKQKTKLISQDMNKYLKYVDKRIQER